MKEIIKKEEVYSVIKDTVKEIAEVVQFTYGPNGNTVILVDDEGNPYATKDGVSVAKSIQYNDSYKNIIATLIKQAAKKTLDEAGDGTSGSICLSNSFIQKGFKLLEEGHSYSDIKKQLETLLGYVTIRLEELARNIEKEDLYRIGYISSNSDEEIADIVDKAFKHSNRVKVEEGDSFKDELVEINGMRLVASYFNQAFINNESKYNIEYKDSFIILIDGKLTKLETISNILQKVTNKPIIIIADHFEDNIVNILKENYNRGALQIALVKSPGIGNFRRNVMKDISIYTGATLLNPNKTYTETAYIGTIDGIEVNKEHTTIFKKKFNKEVSKRIKELNIYLQQDINNNEKELVQQRIDQLSGSTSIIKVGGKSDIEIKERRDRIDDAVRAVSCAIEEGVIEGAGLSLVKIALEREFKNDFMDCLYTPYLTLFGLEDVHIKKRDIILHSKKLENVLDPLKVIRCSLENSISVAKTILGTKAIVLPEQLWKN